MKSEFRQRAFLPLMIPLAVLGTIAVVVGLFAAILLYLPQDIGNIVGITAAAGILLAGFLATSQDSLDPLKKVGVAIAVAIPVVFGAGTAISGICDTADCPANFKEIIRFPAWAPTIVSSQPAAFDNETVTLPVAPPEDATELAIVFDNQSGIPHNLVVTTGQERTADPAVNEAGDAAATATFSGGQEGVFFLPPEAGEYLFFCSIHDGMDGTLIIEVGAAPAVDGTPVEGA